MLREEWKNTHQRSIVDIIFYFCYNEFCKEVFKTKYGGALVSTGMWNQE
jgi:hypothetical protein